MYIKIENLSKSISNEKVLQDINLNLNGGTIYGFIGRNGSGKSMLFKAICGFVKPDAGIINVNGNDIYKNNSFPDSTAALIERPNYIPDLTGFENLKLLASIRNIVNNDRIFETLNLVNLFDEKDKKFKNYSLGMKQKLGIAQVLMENPDIIILDEPFNGIEEESANKIRDVLLDEKKKGKLILVATHIKEDIEKLCDVIYIMKSGRIE